MDIDMNRICLQLNGECISKFNIKIDRRKMRQPLNILQFLAFAQKRLKH